MGVFGLDFVIELLLDKAAQTHNPYTILIPYYVSASNIRYLFFWFMHSSLSYVPKRQGHRSKVKGITDISQ